MVKKSFYTLLQTTHTVIEALRLFRQHTQTKLAVWRKGVAHLSHSSDAHETQQQT